MINQKIFKRIVYNYIDILIAEYWKKLFCCNQLLIFTNFINNINEICLPKYISLYQPSINQIWDNNAFSFTQEEIN